jgi:trans-aconitate methyltransferase
MNQPAAETPSGFALERPRHQWDAQLYDDKHAFVWKHGAALLELLAPQSGERILDLGCGTGHLTAQIAGAGANVVGIDRAASMIEQARRAYPDLHFEVADGRAFAFPQPFDAVFSNAVLHWIKEPRAVIECVRQALKPGGRFVAEFGGRGNVQKIAAAVKNALHATGSGEFETPWYYPSIGEYTPLLEQAGLEVTYAILFDRPTPLEGEQGMRQWIEMFANTALAQVAPDKREVFFQQVERELRPELYWNDTWFADYRRLRIVAQVQR